MSLSFNFLQTPKKKKTVNEIIRSKTPWDTLRSVRVYLSRIKILHPAPPECQRRFTVD